MSAYDQIIKNTMISPAVLSLIFLSGQVYSLINLSNVSCGLHRGARIVGGSNAEKAEFPWLASLTRRGGHYCAATVLNNRWLLTAAHCTCSGTYEFLKPSQVRATLGEHDLTKPEVPRSQDVGIRQIITHPRYKCGRSSDDVALIQLAEDITWSNTIAPACLPDGSRGRSNTEYVGKTATVAGWGWVNEDYSKGTRADVLQKVNVHVMENGQCQQWYHSQGKKMKINPGQMCAGEEQGGKDSCWADSGGPLMLTEDSVVIGVVSTGIGCARPKLPGLYTRISEYVDWIQENVK